MKIPNLEFHKGLPSQEKVQNLHDDLFHIIVLDDFMEYIVKSVETQNLFTKYCHHIVLKIKQSVMQIYKSNSKELFHLQRYHDRVNMNYIQNSKYFLQFLVNSSNKKQNTSVLKFIDKEQLKILQQISENILTRNTPLTSKEFHELSHHKNFPRKLRCGKISKTLLQKIIQLSVS